MKTNIIKLVIIAICLLSISCKNLKKQSSSSFPKSLPGNTSVKEDTLLKSRTAPFIKQSSYSNNYIPSPEVINSFKPYFISNICPPGDMNHPLYKNFMKAGTDMESLVVSKLSERFKSNPDWVKQLERKIGKIDELKNCTIKHLPVYYLSPNVVQYKTGENIAQYYHLDTSSYKFAIVKDEKLIGIARRAGGFWRLLQLHPRDSVAYGRIVKLHQVPIAFKTNIKIDLPTGLIDYFGYLQDTHIFFAKCTYGLINYKTTNDATIHSVFEDGCDFQRADAFFTTGGYPILKQSIESAYDVIKKNKGKQ